jgi:formylglycine-generating enzyme required for sulfatase activity
MVLGLRDDKMAFDAADNPGIGMMVYRSELGFGTFMATDVQLRWNYGVQGVIPGSVVKADVFGIEMVLVPGGPFWVGDGISEGTFRQGADAVPFQVTATGAVLKASTSGCCDEGEIKNAGIWVDGDGGVSRSAATETDMNPDYPTGYKGFYCMKYEITQGQYRDFLNTLTRTQQNARTDSDIEVATIVNRYVMSNSNSIKNRNGLRCDAALPLTGAIEIYCDLDGDGIKNQSNDGEWIACNFLNWGDGAAYLDWGGLRPLTEMEYEKACRGPNYPVPGEYAWGTTDIVSDYFLISDEGSGQEGILSGFNLDNGHALHSNLSLLSGPCRVGIFPSNELNSGRVSSGAGYYGALDLSGNLFERPLTIGSVNGRFYEGNHGDGAIGSLGDSDVLNWPNSFAYGVGFRGGGWSDPAQNLRVSNRIFGAALNSNRENSYGFRGCRGVSLSGAGL